MANALGATVDGIFAVGAKDMNIALAWAGGIFYTFQIYFDFSGYSDMAIGLGRMAGFRFPENFNYPYTSLSLRDFWKRWHISLTSWFREYVYFPLGGNRKGEIRTGFNRMAVFLLTGIWHGAMWTFVVWGLFHGVFQLLETYLIHPDKWKKPLARVYTMAVVTVGFVLFRSDSIAQALHMIGQMAGGFRFTDRGLIVLQSLLTFYNAFILVVAAVGATPLLKDSANAAAARLNARTAVSCLRYAASLLLFALTLVHLAGKNVEVPVEIQLRTVAMDSWAGLEHVLKYKNPNGVSDEISRQLSECADVISENDVKMQEIYQSLFGGTRDCPA